MRERQRIVALIITILLVVGIGMLIFALAERADAQMEIEEWAKDCFGELRISPIPHGVRVVCLDTTRPTATPISTFTVTPTRTNTRTLTPTPVVSPTVTETPQPTSTGATPTVTSTSSPTITPTSSGSIEPFPEAAACDFHPPGWHGVWNYEQGCHYDHTHNADPAEFDHLFGPITAYTGAEISYPWQTEGENALKHEGYKIANISNPSCLTNSPNDGCIEAFRAEFHVVGALGATVRFHSFWIEAMLEGGGIVRTGGHSDFGVLCVPYKGEHIPLPGDPPGLGCGANQPPPYRGHSTVETAQQKGRAQYTWNSQARFGWGEIVESFDFQSRDDFGGIPQDDPFSFEDFFLCPDWSCPNNHSTMLVYELVLDVPFSNFVGFTDVQGNVDPSCSAPGPNCAPLIIENAVPGKYSFRVPLRPDTPHEEFDVYFGGESAGWLEYPN